MTNQEKSTWKKTLEKMKFVSLDENLSRYYGFIFSQGHSDFIYSEALDLKGVDSCYAYNVWRSCVLPLTYKCSDDLCLLFFLENHARSSSIKDDDQDKFSMPSACIEDIMEQLESELYGGFDRPYIFKRFKMALRDVRLDNGKS